MTINVLSQRTLSVQKAHSLPSKVDEHILKLVDEEDVYYLDLLRYIDEVAGTILDKEEGIEQNQVYRRGAT